MPLPNTATSTDRFRLQIGPDRHGRSIMLPGTYFGPEGARHAVRDKTLLTIAHRRPIQIRHWETAP